MLVVEQESCWYFTFFFRLPSVLYILVIAVYDVCILLVFMPEYMIYIHMQYSVQLLEEISSVGLTAVGLKPFSGSPDKMRY